MNFGKVNNFKSIKILLHSSLNKLLQVIEIIEYKVQHIRVK